MCLHESERHAGKHHARLWVKLSNDQLNEHSGYGVAFYSLYYCVVHHRIQDGPGWMEHPRFRTVDIEQNMTVCAYLRTSTHVSGYYQLTYRRLLRDPPSCLVKPCPIACLQPKRRHRTPMMRGADTVVVPWQNHGVRSVDRIVECVMARACLAPRH